MASQLSSSSSEGVTVDDFAKTSRWLDLFKLSDFMIQNCQLPSSITFIFFFFVMYQNLISALWYPIMVANKGKALTFYYLYKIAYWSDPTERLSNFPTQFIVFSCLFVVSLIPMLFSYFHFKLTRQMNTVVMYFLRVTHEFMGLVLVCPIAALAGMIVNSYSTPKDEINTTTTLSALSLVLLLAYFIYFIFWATYMYGASSSSCYFEDSYFLNFDQFPLRIFLVLNSIIVFLQPIFASMEYWGYISLIIFHFILLIFCIYRHIFLPFKDAFSNVLCNTVFYTSVLYDVVNLVLLFVLNIQKNTAEITFLIVFVFCIILSTAIYFQIKRTKIKKLFYNGEKNSLSSRLNGDNDESFILSEEEKYERLASINFLSSYSTIFYLHYGLHEICDLFIDMSLVRHIAINVNTTKNLINCLKFIIVFPGENRITNQLMVILKKRRDLTVFEQYLYFQVKKIRLLRQSTSSIQSSEQLQEITRLCSTTMSKVQNFFNRKTVNCGVLFDIYKNISKTHGLFKESLIGYANSTVYRDEYINFLIECEADFTGAILETRRRDLIESGVTYAKDLCFKSFVILYPNYIKQRVLNTKGHMIQYQKHEGSNSQNVEKRSTSTDEMELRMEEEIGKGIIKQARIRIAMQNAIRDKKASNSKVLMFYLVFCLLVSLALFSAMFGSMYNYFDDRYSATKRSVKCSNTLMYFTTTNLANILAWGNQTKRFVAGTNREKQWYTYESPHIGFLDYDLTYSQNAAVFKLLSQAEYIDLTSDFSNFALESNDRANVRKISGPLFEPNVQLTLCHNGSPAKKITTGLGMALTFLYTAQVSLVGNTDYYNWFNSSDEFCHVSSVGSSIASAIYQFRLGIVDEELATAHRVQSFINELTISIPIVYGFYSFIVFIILSIIYLREIQKFAQDILSFEKSVLEAASNSLRKNEKDSEKMDITQNQEFFSNFKIYLYLFCIFICIALNLIMFIMDMKQAESLNKQLEYTTTWSLKSSVRMPFTLIALQSLILALFTSGTNKIETNITTPQREITIWKGYIEDVVNNGDFLIQGDSSIKGIIGFDPIIDNIITMSQCEPDPGNVSMHETYRCNSLNQLFLYYYSLSNDIIEEIDKYNGIIFGKMPGEIPHLVLNHIIPDSIKLNDRFDQLVVSFLNDFKTLHIVLYVLEIIVTIISFIVGILLWQHLSSAFNAALLLLRRISPIAVVNHPKILKYILDISSRDKANEMSTAESIVTNSLSGIVCIGQNETIEVVNKSVTAMLGYSPDQVLGQAIENIFDEESAALVTQKLELMQAKQSALYYEDHINCINDNNIKVPCMMAIIGVENDERVLSFVIVLNEESELLEQQEAAEKAKSRSEKLLYNILPRDIVIRLNSGEKDVSFTVPCATISFIDFVKFSEYSAALNPKEIMGNLSTFFGTFDELLMKYNMLMKIKLIGDVYMCAGGLFNPDASPNIHAEQMINFDLEVIQAIEELNIKLSTLLSVRIGINTGGPLIAGVLGTDKPVFDIIGDPINISSRLQSTDIPGQIQISQSTYDLVCHSDFLIEPRGEVFLKGKGKQPVYIVKPSNIIAFQLSADINSLVENK